MKQLYFLLLVLSGSVYAQVPNGGFEEFIGYGNETRYWGATPFLLQVEIDPEGNSTVVSDNIILEEGIFSRAFYTNDSHSGNRAMEIRNAYNVTKNEVVPGQMFLFNESQGATAANGWNLGSEVLPGTVIEGLGFHYKYFPLTPNDEAQAQLQAFDTDGNLLGTATVIISGEATDYVYVGTPLVAIATGTPAFVTVEFSMATPNGHTTFGNRLVVDDVVTNNLVLTTPTLQSTAFTVSPTLTHSTINITKGSTLAAGDYPFAIINLEGKEVQKAVLSLTDANETTVDVSTLAAGVYVVKVGSFKGKFVKE